MQTDGQTDRLTRYCNISHLYRGQSSMMHTISLSTGNNQLNLGGSALRSRNSFIFLRKRLVDVLL